MNYYPTNFSNQFYGQPMPQTMPRIQPQEPQYTQFTPAQYKQPIGLQGKSVESLDVVKAMDIPLDGSISYFPITDGSAIVTKQLQLDGSSKTIVYKPTEEKEPEKKIEYITNEQLDEAIKKVNSKDLKDDVKLMKRQIEDLIEDMKEINKNIGKRKD